MTDYLQLAQDIVNKVAAQHVEAEVFIEDNQEMMIRVEKGETLIFVMPPALVFIPYPGIKNGPHGAPDGLMNGQEKVLTRIKS